MVKMGSSKILMRQGFTRDHQRSRQGSRYKPNMNSNSYVISSAQMTSSKGTSPKEHLNANEFNFPDTSSSAYEVLTPLQKMCDPVTEVTTGYRAGELPP